MEKNDHTHRDGVEGKGLIDAERRNNASVEGEELVQLLAQRGRTTVEHRRMSSVSI